MKSPSCTEEDPGRFIGGEAGLPGRRKGGCGEEASRRACGAGWGGGPRAASVALTVAFSWPETSACPAARLSSPGAAGRRVGVEGKGQEGLSLPKSAAPGPERSAAHQKKGEGEARWLGLALPPRPSCFCRQLRGASLNLCR